VSHYPGKARTRADLHESYRREIRDLVADRDRLMAEKMLLVRQLDMALRRLFVMKKRMIYGAEN
jgi:hypothetical protein